MRKILFMLLPVAAISTGCYHATIDTGLTPSGQTVERPWAHSFIYGLVPPSTVETAARCPNGVARVETQLSFVNMVASGLTWGIYSPMTITVQCAARSDGNGEPMLIIPEATSAEAVVRIFNEAVEKSRASGAAVLVQF